MTLKQLNSLMETHYLLKSQANAEHLQRSIEQYKKVQMRFNEMVEIKVK